MDIGLLRTFLEVQRTRHFARAARNLFVTQSAVSARIKLLEETLGVKLFTRKRDDIQLTAHGKHLLKSAETIVNLWEEARQSITLVGQEQKRIVVGGLPSLWDIFLSDWVTTLHEKMAPLALRSETHSQDALIQGLLGKTVDVGFMYEPPPLKELTVTEMAPVELIMVSDKPNQSAPEAVGEGYFLMDWGTAFLTEHARWFPELPPPMMQFDRGRLALDSLLRFGGSAYLARPMVEEDLRAGRLHQVEDALSFQRTAFAVYSGKSHILSVIEEALRTQF